MESTTPPSAGLYDVLGWFETNKKRVAIAVGALLAAALVAGLFVWQKGQKEQSAEHALSSVYVPFSPSEPYPAGTGDKFAKVADEYSGTKAAHKARIRAATAYFSENNYPKAMEQFEKVLSQHADSDYVPQAVFGIAATLEAQAKTTEAIAKYKEFSEKYPTDAAAEQAKLNMARLYEQTKQPALAHDVLKKMTEGVAAFTPAASEAHERMRALETAHPELRPPPPMNPNMLNMFSNLPPAVQTNLGATNLLTITNTPAAPTPAPTIIPQATNKP